MQLHNFPHRRLIGAAAIACAAALIPAGASAAAAGSPASPARTARPVTAYVVNKASGTVTPINTVTGKAGTAIPTGHLPVAAAISPNGKTVYVVNGGYVCKAAGPMGATARPRPAGLRRSQRAMAR